MSGEGSKDTQFDSLTFNFPPFREGEVGFDLHDLENEFGLEISPTIGEAGGDILDSTGKKVGSYNTAGSDVKVTLPKDRVIDLINAAHDKGKVKGNLKFDLMREMFNQRFFGSKK